MVFVAMEKSLRQHDERCWEMVGKMKFELLICWILVWSCCFAVFTLMNRKYAQLWDRDVIIIINLSQGLFDRCWREREIQFFSIFVEFCLVSDED